MTGDLQLERKNREEGVPILRGRSLPHLAFPSLDETGFVRHAFTTRVGGVSEGVCATLNLSFSRGDKEEAVRENFRRVAEELGAAADQFVFTDQTHTTNIRVVAKEDAGKGLTRPKDYSDIDGLVTNVPGIVLSVFTADCVPVFLADPVHKAIGLVHSGWRGTAGRIAEKALRIMADQYGTDPADVICAVAPSICQECYEISRDVAEIFGEAFAGRKEEILTSPLQEIRRSSLQNTKLEKSGAAVVPQTSGAAGVLQTPGVAEDPQTSGAAAVSVRQILRSGHPEDKFHLDLWQANRIVLEEAGALPSHIAVTDICTCCNPDLLFSHRASHGKRGNLGAFLMIVPS